MYFIYYFLTDLETKEERMFVFTDFLGEIGDIVFYEGRKYKINDYAEDFYDLEEPEDY